MTPASVVRAVIDGMVAGQFEELHRFYAIDTIVTHPFSAGSRALRSRDDVAKHFASAAAVQARLPAGEVANLVIHETVDPEVVIAEVAYLWRLPEQMRVGCIFVVRVRNGQIVKSRDYVDSSASSRVVQRIAELTTEDRT
jgi:ketosteroid isomerase-like protein